MFHQYAFFAALVTGTFLVVGAPTPTAALAAAVYAASVCTLFGVSALYHRITWTPPVRRWLRHLLHQLGVAGTALLVAGGLAYSAGALVYARRRPNPAPAVFGYHEIFHLLVVVGVALHFAAVTLAVQAA